MRALVIQHDHTDVPGSVGDRLTERGYALAVHQVVPAERFRTPNVRTTFPDPEDVDVVVAMGAPWSVYDTDAIGTWLEPELELLRRADAAAVPVLGICFGGQALALAHGGSVARSPTPELGWEAVSSDDEALVPSGPWFQWHYDRWALPAGATEVARNARASQAFVLRRNLAVQFHPEMSPAVLATWLDNGGDEDLSRFGREPGELLAETRRRDLANRARARRLVDAFLSFAPAPPAARPGPRPAARR